MTPLTKLFLFDVALYFDDAFYLTYFFHRFLMFWAKTQKKINPNNGPEFYKKKCPLQKDTRDVLQVFDISRKIKCHTQRI